VSTSLIHLSPSPFCYFFFYDSRPHRDLHSFPTRRSSDLDSQLQGLELQLFSPAPVYPALDEALLADSLQHSLEVLGPADPFNERSEEHTSELQSRGHLVCRLLLEKKKKKE